MSEKMSVRDLGILCFDVTDVYCKQVGISVDELYAYEAVMYYLGHPTANPAQWHEEWMKLRKADGWEYLNDSDTDKSDCRLKPLAELDELEQIKYVVFLNMFRTLRQLL